MTRSGGCWAILALAASLVLPNPVTAHPMGNFSVNHYAEIRVEATALELRYLIDMAEIPTFQEIQDSGIVAEIGHPSLRGYLAGRIEGLKRGLRVEADGRPVGLETVSSDVSFPPGAGGLPTLTLHALYRARLDARHTGRLHDVSYRDTNFPGRVGWKEIVVREGASAALVSSSAPATDRSGGLTDYPTDLLESPPQDLEARLVFARQILPARPSPPDRLTGASTQAVGVQRAGERSAAPGESVARDAGSIARTPRSAFSELMTTERLSPGVILIALAIAAGLGAFHALEPGHGKTLVAAYLVGTRGTLRHAALLGLIVTVTHTSAVYLLGAVTLYASQYVVPQRLYPWLGLVSGLAVAGVGVSLLVNRYGRSAARHAHEDRGHSHHSHGHHHTHVHGSGVEHEHHDHDHHHADRGGPLRLSALIALGVTGGIVPCPAALVVLLSAISMHRVGFGLLLIVAFSVGLAAVLIGLGLVVVCARRVASRVPGNGALVARWLPLASSVIITLTGLGLTVQALTTLGLPWSAA